MTPQKDRTCANCDFFAAHGPNTICRFNPPIPGAMPTGLKNAQGQTGFGVIALYPPVQPLDWCGRFRQNLNGSLGTGSPPPASAGRVAN